MSARNFTLKINQIKGILDPNKMASEAYDVFVKNTPYKTGNARRNTYLFKNEIHADYPYATRLDEGYSSMSPQGMSEPTLEFLEDYIKQNLGK
jgi:hypothetical protein